MTFNKNGSATAARAEGGSLKQSTDSRHLRSLPPDLDLDNLVRLDRYTPIDIKLAEVVAAAAAPPAWKEAWEHSTRGRKGLIHKGNQEASPEERLAVWKAIRDSGVIPGDAGFFLVAQEIAFMTDLRIGEILDEVDTAGDELGEQHGLTQWRWQRNRHAHELDDFQEEFPDDWNRVYIDLLNCNGEGDLAQLYQARPTRFDKRLQRGNEYFCLRSLTPELPSGALLAPNIEVNAEPPAWLNDLPEVLQQSGCIAKIVYTHPATFCFDYLVQNDVPELRVYLAPGHVMDGPHRGSYICRPFCLDVWSLTEIFENVEILKWYPFGDGESDSVERFVIQGDFRGHAVRLNVLTELPEDVTESEADPIFVE